MLGNPLLLKIYDDYGDDFITNFDKKFVETLTQTYLEPTPEKTIKTINDFLEDCKESGLIDISDVSDVKLILKACGDNITGLDTASDLSNFYDSVLSLSFKNFLLEGLIYKGRLFSAMEKGNRAPTFTKPFINDGIPTSWDITKPLINENYLEKLKLLEGQTYKKKDYDDASSNYTNEIFNEFLDQIKQTAQTEAEKQGTSVIFTFNESDRKDYGFTIEQETISEEEVTKINFIRRLGVVIYDLLMAEIGLKTLLLYASKKPEIYSGLIQLFKLFPSIRDNSIIDEIIKFLNSEDNENVTHVTLLQECSLQQSQVIKVKDTTKKLSDITKQTIGRDLKQNTASIVVCNNKKTLYDNPLSDRFNTNIQFTSNKINDVIFGSFHADTSGNETIPFIKKIIQIIQKNNKTKMVIGLDTNLKKKDHLFTFFKLIKESGYLSIAGFELILKTLTEDSFKELFKKLQATPTSGGKRSFCQSQWTKAGMDETFYIDFIIYTPNTLIRLNDIISDPKMIQNIITSAKLSLIKKSGTITTDIIHLQSFLTKENMSDHSPRCSIFEEINLKQKKQQYRVLSWNIAGPNFNWAEYYSKKNDEATKLLQFSDNFANYVGGGYIRKAKFIKKRSYKIKKIKKSKRTKRKRKNKKTKRIKRNTKKRHRKIF